jgi:hypothetical protein
MLQEVGVEVGLHYLHQLGAQMHLLEHPLADQFAGSGCLVVLNFQTPEPPENFSEVDASSRNLRGISQNL